MVAVKATGSDAGAKHIEALIDDGGDITVGGIHGVACTATAADGHNTLAMLARRDGETLNASLKRLDRALGRCCDDGAVVDEVNGGSVPRVRADTRKELRHRVGQIVSEQGVRLQ